MIRDAVLPDSGVWIHAIRHRRTWDALAGALAAGRIWLSSVSVAELYAGSRSVEDSRLLDRLVAILSRGDRIVVPTVDEWQRAGQLLNRRTRLHGALRPRDHLADVLIVLSGARIGATIVTTNVRHFEDWAALMRATGQPVAVERFEP